MATKFEYYHVPLSQPSRAVLLLLKMTKAPHNVHTLDMLKGEHKKPEYLAINPFGKVPLIVHGDFTLTESPAIAKYIVKCTNREDHWYPADVKKAARVDEYLSYQHTTVRKASIAVAMNFFLTEKFTGKKTTEEQKNAAYKLLQDTLEEFENYFLKNGPFIIGDKISIADLFALSEITQCEMSGRDYLEKRPKVKAWMERCKDELKPHYEEVFQPFLDFCKSIK
ncbi:Glutathione S-transferase theta-1 [Holothuria leucospilota]|uniref:Glutathione S-transferase theta-1 n=1 Tax=Holothuria leucospilota TaxID=206669 RepID=A0A9Q0YNX3_HOLLE|nr:Glutathione S-transferase theta-1 [Holothuria leucospilota]